MAFGRWYVRYSFRLVTFLLCHSQRDRLLGADDDGNVFISIHAYSRLFLSVLTLMFTYCRARGRCEWRKKKRKGKEELIESMGIPQSGNLIGICIFFCRLWWNGYGVYCCLQDDRGKFRSESWSLA